MVMSYLGEFSKNSTILLELLTIDEQNHPIMVDNPPTATIEHYNANSVQIMDSVTLNTVENGSKHTYVYEIPSDWPYGTYVIRYSVQIQGRTYTTEETFQLDEDFMENNTPWNAQILNLNSDESVAESIENGASEKADYVLPPEFQIEATVQVNGNHIIITPKQPLKYNHSYMVVLDKGIQSINGNSLLDQRVIHFTSEYKPLYSTPLEIRSVIRDMFSKFTLHEIYAAIRDAGQKVHQLLRQQPDANHTQFRLLEDRDEAYFPAMKFVEYEASRQLLNGLLIKMMNGEINGVGQSIGSGFKLGDFEVQGNQSSNNQTDEKDALLKVIQTLMTEIEKELKYWKDALMGRNARGYAKPINAITRSSAPAPESRDI
jgi:Bacterial Ig-like domain